MADIVTYWRAVELFDPQEIPKPDRPRRVGAKRVETITLTRNGPLPPLPWQPKHPRHREPPERSTYGSEWRHIVYGGVFSLRAVREALAHELGAGAEEDYGGALGDGYGALFAFVANGRGILLEDAVAFSSCAWAAGRLHHPGPGRPGWLDGFEADARKCQEAVVRLLRQRFSYQPSAATGGDGWKKMITEILGSAAEGAVTALIGTMAGTIGPVGTGALAGAAKPVMERARGRLAGTGAAPDAVHGQPAQMEGEGESEARGQAAEEQSETSQGQCDSLGRALEVPDIVAFAAHVAEVFGVPHLADPMELRIESQPVHRRRDGRLPEAEPPLLNSLLAPDLERVRDAAASGYGVALTSYLTDPSEAREMPRTDVRDKPDVVLEGVRPEAFPLARWPSGTGKPLAVSQQFAVNRIVAELAEGAGLFSVNGPPGTGKTTLLRDLIAAIVAERAKVLAELSSPGDAFIRKLTGTATDGKRYGVWELKPALTGFEIVVASSNNRAVENITRELPVLEAIGKEWLGEGAYFVDQATAFLQVPAWAAVAAPLGNQDNLRRFRSRFWYGDNLKNCQGMRGLLRALGENPVLRDPPVGSRFPDGESPAGTTEPVPIPDGADPVLTDWQAATARFRDALRAAAKLQHDREVAAAALHEPVSADSELQAEQVAVGASADWELARGRKQAAGSAAEAARHSVDALRIEQRQHARPRGLRGVLGVGEAMRQWRKEEQDLQRRLAEAYQRLSEAQEHDREAQRNESAVREAAVSARKRAAALAAKRAEQERAISNARQTLGEHFPEKWRELSSGERELSAPWSDRQWTEARTRVFLAALDLHRAFVVGAADKIRQNLEHLQALTGRRRSLPPPAERTAWQTLFLLVPVVSTTFASCGRLFAGLGRESLGWALVDEAGQALPQAAVGALWRARRAVLLGDPLQLEPVTQVPDAVQEALRRCHPGVADEWLPSATSAQGLADRVNRWGTSVTWELRDGRTEQIWIGAPLRVNRRCEEPMFGISNTIAYQGLMVRGTGKERFPGPPHPDYPDSSWVDVDPDGDDGKWVPAQGEALATMVSRLLRSGVRWEQIRVLSPFRDVIGGCKDRCREETDQWRRDASSLISCKLGRDQIDAFIQENIGTVHTMQGREADVVILVLGTDRSRRGKAREWASRPANLLNVAVSRARRRLFVVGSYAEWAGHPNFSVLADRLGRTHRWSR